MNEEQIAELKALVDDLESQGLSTADIQSRVDQRKAEFAETVEVTDEIQTTPTEGKTNGVYREQLECGSDGDGPGYRRQSE